MGNKKDGYLMENEILRDALGLGVLLMVIGAAQLWGALLGA